MPKLQVEAGVQAVMPSMAYKECFPAFIGELPTPWGHLELCRWTHAGHGFWKRFFAGVRCECLCHINAKLGLDVRKYVAENTNEDLPDED